MKYWNYILNKLIDIEITETIGIEYELNWNDKAKNKLS